MKGQVRPGYKQTEVGVIPEDWRIACIGELACISSGTTPARAQADRYFSNGSIRWVKTLDLNNGAIIETEEAVTSVALAETCLQRYPKGTVLVAMYGGYNQIGRTGILDIQATVNQALTAIQTDRKQLYPKFLLYVLNYRVDYWRSVASSSRKDPNITSNDVRAFPLSVPPVAEQEAIAEALSDADALIESLEQLLTKKRHLKQGAMQELLTGKKRLPGFSGEWETKTIASFAAFVTKGATPTTYGFNWLDDGVLFLRSECVSADGLDLTQSTFISEAAHAALNRGEVREGDILMTITGNVGRVVHLPTDFGVANINQHIARIRIKAPKVSSDFVFHFLSQANVRAGYALITTGQAFPQISLKQVRETLVPLPSYAEQTAIATILSDMDAEIADLEAQLAKTRTIKQGMMHKLLTGEIRLL